MARVLVLEDDENVSFYVRELLEDMGVEAVMCETAEDAEARLSDGGPFDLIVMDAGTGRVKGGWEAVVEAFRAAGFDGPIILWTGSFEAIRQAQSGRDPNVHPLLKGRASDFSELLERLLAP